jgi:hypothetical protein
VNPIKLAERIRELERSNTDLELQTRQLMDSQKAFENSHPGYLATPDRENQYDWLNELIQNLPIPLALVDTRSGKIVLMSEKNKELMDGMPLALPNHEFNERYYFLDVDGKRLTVDEWPRSRAMRGEVLNGELLLALFCRGNSKTDVSLETC